MKNILLASLGAVAACANDPFYNSDPLEPFAQLSSDQAFDAEMCSYRFDAIETAAATLDKAIQTGDATRYAPSLDKLNKACSEFYSGSILSRSRTCPEAMRKAGDPAIGRQMIERANAVCEVARGLPADMPDQPGKYE